MSVDSLLDRLLAMSVTPGPIDVTQIRKDIHAEFDAATTVREREALLGAHKAVCDMIERQIKSEDLEEFKKIRDQDYCLLLMTEAKIGDNSPHLNPHRMAEITRREVAAGRMAWDHELFKLSLAGAATIPA